MSSGETPTVDPAAEEAPPEEPAAGDRSDRPGSDGEHALQERFDTVERADGFYDGAMQSSLTDRMVAFLADRWLGVVGSVGPEGPRLGTLADGPGMVRVPDPDTVAWPAGAAVGEGAVLDGDGSHLSLVTVDWFDTTVGLHVNGAGERVETLDGEASPLPGGWVRLDVEEAYIHCAKHIPELSVRRPAPSRVAPEDRERTTHDRLDERCRRFVGSRLLAFLGTADADGETDVSPRVGPTGFVQVLDEETLAWPEYRGNGVHASLGNMYERPRASLSFVDWWSGEAVVEVRGSTRLAEDVDGAEDLTDVDRTKTWVVLEVDGVELVESPPLPRLSVASFDPPWGTDDVEAKRSGYFTD